MDRQTWWDDENRVLAIVDDKDVTTTFRYDAQGERTHKVSQNAVTLYPNHGASVRGTGIDTLDNRVAIAARGCRAAAGAAGGIRAEVTGIATLTRRTAPPLRASTRAGDGLRYRPHEASRGGREHGRRRELRPRAVELEVLPAGRPTCARAAAMAPPEPPESGVFGSEIAFRGADDGARGFTVD